jgi:hypothetical protein
MTIPEVSHIASSSAAAKEITTAGDEEEPLEEALTRDKGGATSPLGPKEAGALVHDLSTLSLHELWSYCKEHGLPAGGRKVDLIERLAKLVTSEEPEEQNSPQWSPQQPTPRDLLPGQLTPQQDSPCARSFWVPPTRSPCALISMVESQVKELRHHLHKRRIFLRSCKDRLPHSPQRFRYLWTVHRLLPK